MIQLGIVLFQMLSGAVPFEGDQQFGVLMKHLQEPVPLLHSSNPAVPTAVDAVIQKATAKNREDRYASAGALTQELKNAMNTATYPVADQRHYAPTILASYPPPSDWSAPTQVDSAPIPTMPAVIGTPGQRAPRPASTRTRHSWLAWIAVPIVFVLTLGGLLVGIPQVFPHPAEPLKKDPTPAQHAQGVVERFYQHINARDYTTAYALEKTNSGQGSYCSLVDGYMLTEHDDVTYNGVTKLPDGTFKVAITIVATELFAKGTVKTTYDGYEVVDQGTWQIKSGGHLVKNGRVPVAAPPMSSDPLQAAQAVVQQFHSDINARNYPDAYSLWGTDFHNTTDYCSFVEGYSRTRSDTVHMDNTTQLSNGTVQLAATVNATEETNSGTTMKVYHETYIAGQEYGTWRIINGTLL